MTKRVYNNYTTQSVKRPSEYLTGVEARKYLGMGASSFARYVAAGVIPYRLRKTISGGYKKMYDPQTLDKAMTPKDITEILN